MKVTNPTEDDIYVPVIGDVVAAGATVDVGSAVARALLSQGWGNPRPTKHAALEVVDPDPDPADEATTPDPADEATTPDPADEADSPQED